jgi:hypothetical protein
VTSRYVTLRNDIPRILPLYEILTSALVQYKYTILLSLSLSLYLLVTKITSRVSASSKCRI